jgi:hypothetical protein
MMSENVLRFDLDALPMNVFKLADRGLTVDSLTSGHGMAENEASSSSFCSGGGGSSCGGGGGWWDEGGWWSNGGHWDHGGHGHG